MVNPVPIKNKPAKKIQYVLLNAAGTNNNAPIDIQKSDRAHPRKKKLSPVAEKALQVVDEIGVEVTEIAGEAILAGIRQLRKKIKG